MTVNSVDKSVVPTGSLRMGINAANATLYAPAADGSAAGIAADLGQFIAGKLGVPFTPMVYPGSAAYTASFGTGEWDLIITGRNPLAAQRVDFLPDVILIDYVYITAPGRHFASPAQDQVDRPGIRIGVPRNASADAFLTPLLTAAELVRLPGDVDSAIAHLREGRIDLYATGIDSVQNIAESVPGSHILGAFNTVYFAASTCKDQPAQARARLTELVNAAKAAGVVQKALARSGQQGVRAAS